MEARSVLVTGGGGFIGKHLRPLLERQGLNVVSLDYSPAQPGCDPTCYQCDVADSQQVEAIFQTHRFEAVIHLASILPTASRQDPHKATKVNITGSLNLLEAARRFHVKRMIYASSVSVYGTQPASSCVSEDQPPAPEDVYGAAKRYVELLGEAYQLNFGVEFLALRIAMVVGPGTISATSPWRNQIFEYLGRAPQKEVLIPYREDEVLPLVHVEDIAAMLASVALAKGASSTVYNSFAESVIARELKNEVESLNPNIRVSLGTASVSGGRRIIDSSRFARDFGLVSVPLRERLRRAIRDR